MDRSDFCGCKGTRTCIRCEEKFGLENKNTVEFTDDTFVYCHLCSKAWQGYNLYDYRSHPHHSGKSFPLEGVYIREEFLSEGEALEVMRQLDELRWDKSQSGRRKQNFGPKCNFKKQKLRLGDFQGFPGCTKFIQDRFQGDKVLSDFQTIEQCTLEYTTENGASIDNHIDDCWIWGERIVTVNVIGDSVLTLTYYTGDENKYNLKSPTYSYTRKYPNVPPRVQETSLAQPQQHDTSLEQPQQLQDNFSNDHSTPNSDPKISAIPVFTSATSTLDAKTSKNDGSIPNYEKMECKKTSVPLNGQEIFSESPQSLSHSPDSISNGQGTPLQSLENLSTSPNHQEFSLNSHVTPSKSQIPLPSRHSTPSNGQGTPLQSLENLSNSQEYVKNTRSESLESPSILQQNPLKSFEMPTQSLDSPSVKPQIAPSIPQEARSIADTLRRVSIRIPMPARSLLVLRGEARYEWLHCVLRSDVTQRRVCLAYREFTNVNCDVSRDVREMARRFF